MLTPPNALARIASKGMKVVREEFTNHNSDRFCRLHRSALQTDSVLAIKTASQALQKAW